MCCCSFSETSSDANTGDSQQNADETTNESAINRYWESFNKNLTHKEEGRQRDAILLLSQ